MPPVFPEASTVVLENWPFVTIWSSGLYVRGNAFTSYRLRSSGGFAADEISVSYLDRNYAGILIIWDRLFGTYRDQPRAGHERMAIGIRTYRDKKWCSWLPGMLALPFRGRVERYAINRRKWKFWTRTAEAARSFKTLRRCIIRRGR